ncbi:hypothetical protein Tco_1143214 [Tanacetum coccineum]
MCVGFRRGFKSYVGLSLCDDLNDGLCTRAREITVSFTISRSRSLVGQGSAGALEKDPLPHLTARQEETVRLLDSNKVPFRRYPKCFLCQVGLSLYYPFDENTYPAYVGPDGRDMGLLDFIQTADPRKVQAVEVQKGGDQVTFLESIKDCFMPLNPPAVGGSSSAAAVEVPAMVEEEHEGVQEEDAYLELNDPDESSAAAGEGGENVVAKQPRQVMKRKLVKQSSVLPPKRLRKDHSWAVPCTGGKSLEDLEQMRLASLPEQGRPSSPPAASVLQEQEGVLGVSDLRIHAIAESSGVLSAPVVTTAVVTTSAKIGPAFKATADPEPDLAGPSHPEDSESSADSFYEIPDLDAEMAKRWYVPKWYVTNDSLLDDDFACRTLVDRVAPPAFFSDLRTIGYDQLSRVEHELELKEKLKAGYDARGESLKKKDLEILRLKAQLAEKEAEAAEAVRLRDQVSSLSREKSALAAEVSSLKVTISQKDNDISLLDSRAAHLKSCLDDANAACTEVGIKVTSLTSERDRIASEVSSLHAGFWDFKEKMEAQQEEQAQELYNRVVELEAHVMDVSGHLEGKFYPNYLTLLAGRRWLLTYGLKLALLKCLKSSEYQGILGHALSRAIEFGMQKGLEAGHKHGVAGRSLSVVEAYNSETAKASYISAVHALKDIHFPLVDLLKSKRDTGIDEVLDCFLLDGPLASLPKTALLQPCLEQLTIPMHHSGDKTIIGETSLSFALMNVHSRAKGARKHVAALYKLMIYIVSDPLSSLTWVGKASASTAPFCIEDYGQEDTDEALGSITCIPHLEVPTFVPDLVCM